MKRDVVLVAGSANLDFVVRAERVPAPGETLLGREFHTFPGGKGANQAVAAARAGGARTRMLLALGNDLHALPLERSLAEAQVEAIVERIPSLPTGCAFICVGDDGENAITVAPGANWALGEDDLPDLHDVRCLLLQLETPLGVVVSWARRAHNAGVRVMLNAAPAQVLPRELLAAVDVLIVNEGELAVVSGVAGDCRTQLAAVDVRCAIVTLGARGCCALDRGAWHEQPGFPVLPIDTTAAGDTFCGTLAGSIADDRPLEEGLRRACAASALACTRVGAQSSIPTREEVDELLASTPHGAAA